MRSVVRSVCLCSTLATVLCCVPASANYNANIAGTVIAVSSYNEASLSGGATVFTLSQSPLPVGTCTSSRFAISSQTVADQETRDRMVAMLLLAHSTGAQVSVGYDNSGGFCDHSYFAVYRVDIL